MHDALLGIPLHRCRWEWLKPVLDRIAELNGSIPQYRQLVERQQVIADVGS